MLKDRKRIYEKKYPETKKGAANQYTKVLNAESANSTPSFDQDTAAKTGASTRAIHVDLQLANNLSDKVKDAVVKADLPKTEALKLARMEPEKQEAFV